MLRCLINRGKGSFPIDFFFFLFRQTIVVLKIEHNFCRCLCEKKSKGRLLELLPLKRWNLMIFLQMKMKSQLFVRQVNANYWKGYFVVCNHHHKKILKIMTSKIHRNIDYIIFWYCSHVHSKVCNRPHT